MATNSFIEIKQAQAWNTTSMEDYRSTSLVSPVNEGVLQTAQNVKVITYAHTSADGEYIPYSTTYKDVVMITKYDGINGGINFEANGHLIGIALDSEGKPDLDYIIMTNRTYSEYVNEIGQNPYNDVLPERNDLLIEKDESGYYVIRTKEATAGGLYIRFACKGGTFKVRLKSGFWCKTEVTGYPTSEQGYPSSTAIASYDSSGKKHAVTQYRAPYDDEITVEFSRADTKSIKIYDINNRATDGASGVIYNEWIARLGIFQGNTRLTPATIGDRFTGQVAHMITNLIDLDEDTPFEVRTEMREFTVDLHNNGPLEGDTIQLWSWSFSAGILDPSYKDGLKAVSREAMLQEGQKYYTPPQDYIANFPYNSPRLYHPCFLSNLYSMSTFVNWLVNGEIAKNLDGEDAGNTDPLQFENGAVISVRCYDTQRYTFIVPEGVAYIEYECSVKGERLARGIVYTQATTADLPIYNDGTRVTVRLKAVLKDGYAFQGWTAGTSATGGSIFDKFEVTTAVFVATVGHIYISCKVASEGGSTDGKGELLCDNYGNVLYDDGGLITIRAAKTSKVKIVLRYHDNDGSNHSITGTISCTNGTVNGEESIEINENISEPGTFTKEVTVRWNAVVIGNRYGGTGNPIYFDKMSDILRTKYLFGIEAHCQIAGHRFDAHITAADEDGENEKDLFKFNDLNGTFSRTFEV